MPDFRAFCSPPTAEPSELLLSPEESHHLVTVNRARAGDTVVAFDGRGHEWVSELRGESKNGATLKVRFRQQIRPLAYEITLGQALPKGQFMDAIVRKATEIGVALQPHSQTLQEYPEMAALRAAMYRETGTPDGATLQMFFRLGYAGDSGPSPRRALASFLQT